MGILEEIPCSSDDLLKSVDVTVRCAECYFSN